MHISIQSEWHGGGTGAPARPERGGFPDGKQVREVTEAVAQRASEDVSGSLGTAESCGSGLIQVPSGTKWHDRPQQSVCGHGRA